nr:hypothetical protein [Bacteroidota bacterium]
MWAKARGIFLSRFLISIDKSIFDQETILGLLNRLRMEYLIKKADLGDDIEQLGEEIKTDWWKKNKGRFIEPEK